MKKIAFVLTALMLLGTVQNNCMAQQRKPVGKTAVRRTTTTAKNTAVRKATPPAAPTTVTIADPVIVNGHVAFLGVPVKQAESAIKQQLKAKGLTNVSQNGFQYLGGTAYGVKVKVFVEGENQIVVREAKTYTKSQAKARINAYKKAFAEATGDKITEDCLDCDEGGGITIETTGGTIEARFYNQDEVDFSSKYFDIVVTFTQY